jgi:WD40 repeat protein
MLPYRWRLTLRVTTKHVYDLAWSPDGEFFIAGSTDNTATIWKASTGQPNDIPPYRADRKANASLPSESIRIMSKGCHGTL